MSSSQEERFQSIRQLVDEAQQAVTSLSSLTGTELGEISNDSSKQAENLQRIQQEAGTMTQAMTQITDLARHARSFQAQEHQRNTGNKPM